MGEMVASALAQEGVSRLSSYISTKLDDRASRAHTVARLEMALSRLEFVLEWSRKQPITYVSLIRRWNKFRCAYNEGVYLLNKHKLPALQGHEETGGQVVVTRSSSFLGRIIASAANFSISSLAGLSKQCLSSNVVQIIEVYADSVGEFVADVESACPLRRDTFFPYPFVRQLLQGKYLSYNKVKGRQKHHFIVSPVILEGRGVEALLWYEYFDPERLDKSLCLGLVLRLSESTDIVGAAIDCVRSSASLLNLPAQDAVMGELTRINLLDQPSRTCSVRENNITPCLDDFFFFLKRKPARVLPFLMMKTCMICFFEGFMICKIICRDDQDRLQEGNTAGATLPTSVDYACLKIRL